MRQRIDAIIVWAEASISGEPGPAPGRADPLSVIPCDAYLP